MEKIKSGIIKLLLNWTLVKLAHKRLRLSRVLWPTFGSFRIFFIASVFTRVWFCGRESSKL